MLLHQPDWFLKAEYTLRGGLHPAVNAVEIAEEGEDIILQIASHRFDLII